MTDWWCIHKKKSGQKSENMVIGCLEYGQKYFGVGRSVELSAGRLADAHVVHELTFVIHKHNME